MRSVPIVLPNNAVHRVQSAHVHTTRPSRVRNVPNLHPVREHTSVLTLPDTPGNATDAARALRSVHGAHE